MRKKGDTNTIMGLSLLLPISLWSPLMSLAPERGPPRFADGTYNLSGIAGQARLSSRLPGARSALSARRRPRLLCRSHQKSCYGR